MVTDPSEPSRTLEVALELSGEYLRGLPGRPVGPRADSVEIMAALGRDLAEAGIAPDVVIREMAVAVEPGLVASSGPRYFGFVVGGALPASIGADWLAAVWDQNAVLHAASPAAAAVEQVAGEWVLGLLGLPADAGFGLPGGAGLANVVALAAARHAVLARVGWDVEARGLYGAPEITLLIGAEAHATLESALQYLGLGRERVVRVPTDEQGRMRADAFASLIDRRGRAHHRLQPGGEREQRCVRPDRPDRRPSGRQVQHVAPRGRSVRALGRSLAALPAPRRRCRAG